MELPTGDYLTPVETMFYFLGLDTPTKRFMAVFGVTESLVLTAKPRFAFDEMGNMRPWRVTEPDKMNGTYVPWWLPGLITASLSSLLI